MTLDEAIRKAKYLYEHNKGRSMVLNSWRDNKNDKVDQEKKYSSHLYLGKNIIPIKR
jgi:hypothetical protein